MIKTTFIPDWLKVLPQYLIPQHFLSRLLFYATRFRWRPWKDLLISSFIRFYRVDMDSAADPDYHHYHSFNHFFTRELKAGCRSIAKGRDAIASPVDGTISQLGVITDTDIFQAKGRRFSLGSLLAGDDALTERFRNGHFATLYLSPKDYHRIHMPVDGRLTRMMYVPGRLFAVNQAATRGIDQLFSRNERIINLFDTAVGNMAVITIGALFVGSMETVWGGRVTPAGRQITDRNYLQGNEDIALNKGEELGRFNMGSTVILLFEAGRIQWLNELTAEMPIVMGQAIGKIVI
ncbi:MAG: archaetidylserine decarboxylase [Gammaproteobacteria bacterium]